MSVRCKITGCDLDECGVCRRCGAQKEAKHQWKEAERDRPCFPRQVCERCDAKREQPDHDWEPTPNGMKCSRCNFSI